MGLFDIFKKKTTKKLIKVNALNQKILTEIMKSEKYIGKRFEGLTDKQIESLERTQKNPVFEITNHKVSGFTIIAKGKSYNVMFNDNKVGTIKSDEITEDKLNVKIDGFINGGKYKYLDVTDNGNIKLFTKDSRFVLYI